IQISYNNDYQEAISLLKEVFEKDEAVLSVPETVVGVFSFDESGVTLSCMPWVKGEDYWSAYFRLMGRIKDCFDKNRIEFPYPQRVVHLAREEGNTLEK
ncbi:MAG: mechanosensitive ion channel family protein, partial [Filifactor alocis]|nr:mechanosensitive ion channel family protein [Filifactor alocis]